MLAMKRNVVFICFLLAMLLVGRTGVAQKIEAASFGKSISEADQLSEVGTKFGPLEKVILKVSLDSRPETGQLSCKFFLAKQHITTVSADLSELAAKDLPENLNAYGVFSLSPTAPFPVSDAYRADVYLNDKQLGSYSFEVVENAKTQRSKVSDAKMRGDSANRTNRSTESIVDTLLRGTAYVHATDELGNGWTGTAWVLDREQRILVTNDHVANAAAHDDAYGEVAEIELIFPEYKNGRVIHDARHYKRFATPIKAKVIYGDKQRDLAILQAESLPDENITELELATASSSAGDSLHSLGGVPRGSEGYWIYTSGEVRAVYQRSLANGYDARTVEANMQTNQGNSGGPVVNESGQLVAVVEGHQTNARSVSLYIDLLEVKQFLADCKNLIAPKTSADFVVRGDHHYEAGRLDDAMKDYTRALRRDPSNAEAMSSRGWVFYSKGDSDTALVEFDGAIKTDKMMLYAYHGRATVYSERAEYDAAIQDLTFAITNATEDADAADFYNERGVAYWRKDDIDKASQDFGRAIDANPDNAWAHCNSGNMFAERGEHEEALAAYLKAIDLDPKEAEFFWSMAKSAQAIGKMESAFKLYDAAIALDGTQADYLISKAKCLAETGNFLEASELLVAAIDIDDTDSRVINEVGLVGFELGNYPMAEMMFQQAANLDPQDATCWLNVGHASLKQHNWSDAVGHLTKAIELDGDDGDAYALRGEAFSGLGQMNAAKKDFLAARKLFPATYERYATKLLKVGNRTPEELTVMVRYRVKGSDGVARWYPLGDKTLEFNFKPGEVSYLTADGKQVHGDRFRIWAVASGSGGEYSDFKFSELVSAGPAGYISGGGEAGTELYQFVKKQ